MSKVQRRKGACYCINLRRTTNTITELYDNILSPTGLSVNQFSLLKNAARLEQCSISDLANYVGLERTTLTRSLKPLFEKGYLVDASAEGKRNREILVTTAGKDILEIAGPLWESAQAKVEEHIGKERVTQLNEIISLLSEL